MWRQNRIFSKISSLIISILIDDNKINNDKISDNEIDNDKINNNKINNDKISNNEMLNRNYEISIESWQWIDYTMR